MSEGRPPGFGAGAGSPPAPIRVAVLGSTGSIGVSTLNVIQRHPGRFQVVTLTANRSVEALARQVETHAPRRVVVADDEAFAAFRREGGGAGGGGAGGGEGASERGEGASTHGKGATTWASGRAAVLAAAEDPDVDVVVNALVGFAGLEPTLRALRAGKRVALANKESLVTGGDLVLEALESNGGELIPVDSEHSAILQCLDGCRRESVGRLVLTASGGPFRGWSQERLARVSPAEALRHPTWDMGAKISIDSATLANKALEVIEAHVLYGVDYQDIDVVIHPQSVIHSLVEFVDGSVMAQLGFPTMELPILYALAYPERVEDVRLRTFDPVRSSPLTFEEVDREAFPLFRIGVEAGRRGGTAPAAFNAANEVAVQAFLEERVSFPGMAGAVEAGLEEAGGAEVTRLEDIMEADRNARRAAGEWISRRRTRATGS
jgi:1-deoxy-D-xylulose-5-phosphate reductoisomerase